MTVKLTLVRSALRTQSNVTKYFKFGHTTTLIKIMFLAQREEIYLN